MTDELTMTAVDDAIRSANGEHGPSAVTGVQVAYQLGRETRDGFPRWVAYAVFGDGASHVLRAFNAARGKQAAVLYAEEVAAVLGVPIL